MAPACPAWGLQELSRLQPPDTMYLEKVPSETVRDRLRIDGTISTAQTRILAPALHLVNWIERWRGKSDGMVMPARRVEIASGR